jgi:hypothetical protein
MAADGGHHAAPVSGTSGAGAPPVPSIEAPVLTEAIAFMRGMMREAAQLFITVSQAAW